MDADTKDVKLTGTNKGNVYIMDWKSAIDKEAVCFMAKNKLS